MYNVCCKLAGLWLPGVKINGLILINTWTPEEDNVCDVDLKLTVIHVYLNMNSNSQNNVF